MLARKSAVAALAVMLPLICAARPPELRLPSLAHFQRDAVESVNISIGPLLLGFAGWFVSDRDPDGAAVKKLLHGLHRVRVHTYRFKSEHVYAAEELEALRSQLEAPGWHKMVQVRDTGTSANVDVYYALDEHGIDGLVVLAVEPYELTLVDIDGRIDPGEVATLRHTFVPAGARVSPVSPPSP